MRKFVPVDGDPYSSKGSPSAPPHQTEIAFSAAERRHTLFWSGGDALGKIPAAKAAIGINAMRQPSNKSTDIGPATERVFEGRARFANLIGIAVWTATMTFFWLGGYAAIMLSAGHPICW